MLTIRPVVLYVEDEETDRFLVQRAFVKEGLGPALRMVNHGQAAIDYLSGAGAYADRENYPLPGVVLLDLNLPEVHGFEVLKWIRAHPSHHELPVVVFTSSAREEDHERARLLGANEFMQKPGLPSLFQEVARTLNKQWLGTLNPVPSNGWRVAE
jgi:CheY-like chemotaxis protein